jgi:hypothetical protein
MYLNMHIYICIYTYKINKNINTYIFVYISIYIKINKNVIIYVYIQNLPPSIQLSFLCIFIPETSKDTFLGIFTFPFLVQVPLIETSSPELISALISSALGRL